MSPSIGSSVSKFTSGIEAARFSRTVSNSLPFSSGDEVAEALPLVAFEVGRHQHHDVRVTRDVAQRVRQVSRLRGVVAAARQEREQGEAHGHSEAGGGAARVRLRMAAGAQTLKRTPLYDRHVAAGARLVPFAGWEMPVQYAGIREEHVAVRPAPASSTSPTWARSRRRGPDAGRFLQRVLSNDVRRSRRRGAVLACCAARTAACSTTSSPTGTAGGFLTVTNASNHERDLAWMRRQARGYDVEVTTASRTT